MSIDVAPGLGHTLEQRWALRDLLRRIAVQGVAGVIAGVLVGGLGGWLLVRAAAADPVVDEITEKGIRIGVLAPEGSVGLVILGGALMGALAAPLLVILQPWLAWAGRWQGLFAGVALLGIAGATLLATDRADASVLEPAWLDAGMLVALVIGCSWVAVALADWWMRRDVTSGPVPLHLTLLALGAPFVVGILAVLVSPQACGCEPAPGVGALVALAGLAAVAMWIAEVTDHTGMVRVVRPVGIGLTTLAFVLGSWRVVGELTSVI